jgi:hypothetical protein
MFYKSIGVGREQPSHADQNNAWHPDDDGDERNAIRQRKKTFSIPTASAEGALWQPTAGQLLKVPNLREQRRFIDEVMLPLLFRTTNKSREGCLPNETRWEVNQWATEWVAEGFDLISLPLWSTTDDERTALVEGSLVSTARSPTSLSRGEVLRTLPRLDSLSTVRLSHNYQLKELPIEALHHIRTLKYLDLSFNDLERIPSILFLHPSRGQSFPDLVELRLNNNKLRWLPREVFLARRLQLLNVENNLLAGFPSTLGNHCVKDGVLVTLHIGNNVMNSEMEDVAELQHVEAAYDVWAHMKAQHLKTLQSQSLTRQEEQLFAAERSRMPFSREVVWSDLYNDAPPPISIDGTAVLRAQLLLLQSSLPRASLSSSSMYEGAPSTVGLQWERPTCNLCQRDLLELFETFEQRMRTAWDAAERTAAAKGTNHANPYAFILADAVPPRPLLPEGICSSALGSTLWERDSRLLEMLHEIVTAAEPPPLCCAKFVDVAENVQVPLLYYLCGSSQCLRAFSDLSSDGNAAQNFSVINYSTLDSEGDDEY